MTALTRELFDEAVRMIESAPPRPPEYAVAPHHPRCLAVRLAPAWEAEFGEPCPDPLGWWRFCTCGTGRWLALCGYATLRREAELDAWHDLMVTIYERGRDGHV